MKKIILKNSKIFICIIQKIILSSITQSIYFQYYIYIIKNLSYLLLILFELNGTTMSQSLQEFFIRPLRQTYYNYDLGPQVFYVQDKKVNRNDFAITNDRNIKILASFYETQQQMQQTTVIYLHTHHGSRLEGCPLTEPIIKSGMNLCLFDFAGYGNSEGDTVTLGIQEVWDIEIVIKHLQTVYNQKKFILWGRSMGAVTALLYLYQNQSTHKKIVGGIYDCPFYSLQKLTLQIGSRNSGLPQVVLKPLVYLLKNTLKEKIDFSKLELVEKIQQIKVPGVFITSKEDQFVSYYHSQLLYKHYGGKKQLHYIQKDHNQTRKQSDLENVFKFIRSIHQANSSQKKWKKVLNNHLRLLGKKKTENNQQSISI